MTGRPRPARLSTASLALAAACATGGAHTPPTARPIDEPRAVHVIAASVSAAGEKPQVGEPLRLSSGREIHIDVAIAGHRYGIAYLTAADLGSLERAEDLPPPMPEGDLPIVQGTGPDHDKVVLVLYAADYLQDDLAGERHEHTTIAAENKLRRDVRDFLTQARARKLP